MPDRIRYASKCTALVLLVSCLGALLPMKVAIAQEVHWSFTGPFGTFDRNQLQRGFQVFKENCSTCHALRGLTFGRLADRGGPEFPVEAVVKLALGYKVEDGPDDMGRTFQRPGRLADFIPSPYKNSNEARAAHNGALPSDLTYITIGRGLDGQTLQVRRSASLTPAKSKDAQNPWYLDSLEWARAWLTRKETEGADKVYAYLTGFADDAPPFVRLPNGKLQRLNESEVSKGAQVERCVSIDTGVASKSDTCRRLQPGYTYNAAFPGHETATQAPLQDGQIAYQDGTRGTVNQYAQDVTAFLVWTAQPTIRENQKVLLRFWSNLALVAGLLAITYGQLWGRRK